jgi:two-component system cell cycle sensor histidine kinase/response regulator CckA
VKPDSVSADLEVPTHKIRRILLLDDDSNTLFVLHSVLEQTKAQVIECEDEPCAVRQCSALAKSIDLLVADVMLQDSNGPAVVRKVKPFQPSMRLLYISGFSLAELHRRGLLSVTEMSPGLVEFRQKPFSPGDFLDRVERLLPN